MSNSKIPVGVFPVSVSFNKKRNKWDKVPNISKGTNWQTYQANQKELDIASHIGAIIPAGVLVLDLDISENKTVEDLQDKIEEVLDCEMEIDWPSAFIHTTISGGAHYGFKIPTDIAISQRTNCLEVTGFDIRVAGKGWICSGDSYVSDGSKYRNALEALYSIELPELPISGLDRLQTRALITEDDDFMSMVSDNNLGLTDDEITDYMSRLPESFADEQDTWFRVGMGLYHETCGNELGWELFDTFSQLCPDKYDENKNRARWESFGGDGNIKLTFASIIKWVHDNEVVEKIESAENTVENLLERLDNIKSFADLKSYCIDVAKCCLDRVDISRLANTIKSRDTELVGIKLSVADIKSMMKRTPVKNKTDGQYLEDYVFMTSSAEYMNRTNKSVMGPRAFDVKYTRQTPLDLDDNPQHATLYTMDKIECVEAAMYAPMFGEIFNYAGLDYLNSYAPTTLIPSKGNGEIVKRLIGHIAHLLPNVREQEIVINYLAHNVQRPGVKLQWGIVLQGVQGDGKTLLSELMQLVMGINNVRLLNVQTLESNFSAWAAGQCMTFIEELKLDNFRKYEILNNLKPYISNQVVEVTAKGKDPRVMLNTTNYFALTNFKDALPIDDKDRRYCILFSQWQSSGKLATFEADNPNYYHDIYEDMRDGADELLWWLLNHNIPQSFLDTKRAPTTAAKHAMSALAKSDGFLLVEDALAEFQCNMINDEVVNLTALIGHTSSTFAEGYEQFPKSSAVKNILTDMGYHHIGVYKNKQRKNQTVYCKDDSKKAEDFKDELNLVVPSYDEF